MPSTFVHGLLPPACIQLSRGALPKLSRAARLRLFFATAVLANAPDLDLIPATLAFSRWQEVHRNWGHNIFMLAVWTVLGVWLLRRWAVPELKSRSAWILSSTMVLSHVVLDSMMKEIPYTRIHPGVPLFWPFSRWQMVLPFPIFTFHAVGPEHNVIWGNLTSPDFWGRVFLWEISSIVLLSLAWMIIWNAIRQITGVLRGRARTTVAATADASETKVGENLAS